MKAYATYNNKVKVSKANMFVTVNVTGKLLRITDLTFLYFKH